MATGNLSAFPIPWNDSAAAFGLVPASGGTFTGGVNFTGSSPTVFTQPGINGVQSLSDSASLGASYALGRTSFDAYFGVSGSAGTFTTGDVQGDVSLRAETRLHLSIGATGYAKLDAGVGFAHLTPVICNSPWRPGQYTLSTLPSASAYNGYLIDVTNATGGPKMCRSNGTVWQILNTTTTVS